MNNKEAEGIIAVSDVHLGYMIPDPQFAINHNEYIELADTKNFIEFLDNLKKREDITDFVICGDLLDMWRRDTVGVTLENLQILKKIQELQPKKKVHYLAGNHDYHIHNLNKHHYPFDFKNDPKECLIITEMGGKTYHFKHGYDFEPLMQICEPFFELLCSNNDEAGEFQSQLGDIILNTTHHSETTIQKMLEWLKGFVNKDILKASDISDFSDLLKKPYDDRVKEYEERVKLPWIKLKPDPYDTSPCKNNDVLVYGHTHKPFCHKNAINLGSWIKTCPEKTHNTYLEVLKDQDPKLLVWPTREPAKDPRKGV